MIAWLVSAWSVRSHGGRYERHPGPEGTAAATEPPAVHAKWRGAPGRLGRDAATGLWGRHQQQDGRQGGNEPGDRRLLPNCDFKKGAWSGARSWIQSARKLNNVMPIA